MPRFEYQANKLGKKNSGIIEAKDIKMAAILLRQQGVIPIKITPYKGEIKSAKTAPTGSAFSLWGSKRVKTKDITGFTRQLASLLGSGLPLVKSLDFLLEQTSNVTLKAIIATIGERLRGGATFSDTIAEYPRYFNALYLVMVRAGESGGILTTTLERLAQMREAREELSSKVRGAMIYPVFMFLAMLGCISILVGFVVPRFTVLFEDMGQALPWPTLVLMSCADIVKNWWWVSFLILIIIWVGLKQYTKTETGRLQIDLYKLKAPGIGNLLRTGSMARLCRTIGTLLNSGVPLLSAMQAISGITGNYALEASLERIRHKVQEGSPLGVAMSQESVFFPKYVSEMTSIGEESGTLGPMLLKAAETYERTINQLVKSLTSLIEPIMILVMGGLVAFIVMAMLFPIFQMSLMAG